MNLFSRFPIIVSFLFIALLTSASISLYTYTNIFHKEIEEAINHELRRINQRMIELQGTFNDFNTRQDPNAIHREVSRLSGDKTMQLIAIIDEHYVIKYSSLIEYRNTAIIKLPEISRLIMQHKNLQISGVIAVSDNKKHITGLYPVNAISHPDKHLPSQHAYLYGRFDLQHTLQTVKYKQQQEIIQISLFHFSFLISGFLLLYISMRHRIKSIVQAINEFSDGHYDSRAQLTGGDEFSKIASGFNTMAKQVSLQSQRLREQEQDLSTTLNSIGDAVLATDSKGLITRMNPVAQKLTGWNLHDAIGKSINDVLNMKDVNTNEAVTVPIKQVITSGETVYLGSHTLLTSRQGSVHHISDSAAPIRDTNNKIQGMVIIFNDVTEQYRLRKAASKSERLLTSIMDNSPAVIYVKDTNGRFTYINREFEKIFNLKQENVIGLTLFDIFPESVADEMHKNDQTVFDSVSMLQTEEIVPQHDGSRIYSTIKFPLFDEQGKPDAVCGISTDITTRKKQEQQLYQSQKMESLGKLTGGIAHDYNNMLGIIQGYCELLKIGLPEDASLHDYTNEIYHACERGTQLSKKLLSFSTSKQADLDSININHLLTERSDMLEKTLTPRIKLNFNLATELWPVKLNLGDLEDAIINICINSMHAMPNGGELTICTSNEHLPAATQLQLAEGDYVELSIADSGIGMSKETQEKMFDPFYTSKGTKGTGLGLSQVYGFIKSSNGSIKVDSEQYAGTRLSLYFPRDTSIEQAPSDSLEASPELITNLLGAETILVVDDETALKEFVCTLLRNYGYTVLCADNGEQALEILSRETVNLLFSDVIMPGMNGYQLASTTQQLYPEVKIQLASGFTDKHHIDLADTKLHKNLLYKPFKSVELLTRLREILDQRI